MLFVTEEIDVGVLETSPAEWHDDCSCAASAHNVIGIKMLDDFAERGVALMEADFLDSSITTVDINAKRSVPYPTSI